MKKDDVATKRRYFAAANGFTGFRNYFPAVFDSAEYRRIFVLKGGPGTGKSSLMKKVCAKFPDGAYRNLISCETVLAEDGLLSVKGEPIVMEAEAEPIS